MTRIGLNLLRLLLAATAVAAASCWVPLLDAEPVSRLDEIALTHPQVPGWAQSFWLVRGRFVFDPFATPRETPLAYVCLTVILVAALVALYLSFTRDERMAFFRRCAERFGRR